MKNNGGAPASLARKIAVAKKEVAKAKFLHHPQHHFLFAHPSEKVFCSAVARSTAIKFRSPDFRQKKCGF
ncbi:hypothetical protein KKA20_02625 [Patescibacteria group bacterium]|nr:hypothetical protein [Patescibacteria group bacterium]MBU2415768.1 hypothetical protein [Patescibacteria group bacterium]MBU2456396.1 hypothetical protein [Patescibacteria group bacterium]MBU2474830.1 hypothetical protein [Patescibacteria group bacterium]